MHKMRLNYFLHHEKGTKLNIVSYGTNRGVGFGSKLES